MKIFLNLQILFLLLGLTPFSAKQIQYNTPQASNSRVADSLELVDFYQMTRGELWKIQWDFKQPIDTWFGISLNSLGRVVCIDLDGVPDCGSTKGGGNHLHGILPEINLPFLEHLFLSSNQISGTLPEFSEIPQLLTLQISGNRLEGTLPAFYNLKKLIILDLEYNKLEGEIPNFDLQELQALYLGQNLFYGDLPSFENCPNLKHLHVNNNELDGTLPGFFHLKKLKKLIVQENLFQGKLPQYFRLTSLSVLDVSNNLLNDCFLEKEYDRFTRFSVKGNQLKTCNSYEFTIPSGISPNGDGINDFFEIEGFAQFLNYGSHVEFMVYNLQRKAVFANKDFKGIWNGRDYNDQLLPNGLYIFYLKAGPYILKQTLFIKK